MLIPCILGPGKPRGPRIEQVTGFLPAGWTDLPRVPFPHHRSPPVVLEAPDAIPTRRCVTCARISVCSGPWQLLLGSPPALFNEAPRDRDRNQQLGELEECPGFLASLLRAPWEPTSPETAGGEGGSRGSWKYRAEKALYFSWEKQGAGLNCAGDAG